MAIEVELGPLMAKQSRRGFFHSFPSFGCAGQASVFPLTLLGSLHKQKCSLTSAGICLSEKFHRFSWKLFQLRPDVTKQTLVKQDEFRTELFLLVLFILHMMLDVALQPSQVLGSAAKGAALTVREQQSCLLLWPNCQAPNYCGFLRLLELPEPKRMSL